MNKTAKLEEYREYVHFLAERELDKVFLNSDENHALIVLTELFKHAKERVRIFAGALVGSVGDDEEYIKDLISFIIRGGSVQILLNNFDHERAKESTLYTYLNAFQSDEEYKDRIKVKKTDRTVKMKNPNGGEDLQVHFTTGDDRAYRLEFDIDKRTSRCNFNSSGSIIDEMIALFDEIFDEEDSEDIILDELLA